MPGNDQTLMQLYSALYHGIKIIKIGWVYFWHWAMALPFANDVVY